MTERLVSLVDAPAGYADWLADLKARIQATQQRAALAVNSELVSLYWRLGRDILQRQEKAGWGAKVIERLAHDLRVAFPDMKGFSRANLMYMRAFAEAWPDEPIVQQLVGRLPWGHKIRNYSLTSPPVEEQQEIGSFLDLQIRAFDALAAEAQKAIDLLQERRTALISAAVTGQIDVRKLAAA
jgi:predicted nuclease of restriction endonuclease-like (RecB) superfamily